MLNISTIYTSSKSRYNYSVIQYFNNNILYIYYHNLPYNKKNNITKKDKVILHFPPYYDIIILVR